MKTPQQIKRQMKMLKLYNVKGELITERIIEELLSKIGDNSEVEK
ncbi:MAG: hypothetical protein PHS54_02995 [Clostridia bacterium]|nr:hypothetical protein [Clostridia bacterium]